MKIKILMINVAMIALLISIAMLPRYQKFEDELEYKGYRVVKRYDRWQALYEVFYGEKWYPVGEWKNEIDRNLELQQAKKKITPAGIDPTKLSQEVIEMIHRP